MLQSINDIIFETIHRVTMAENKETNFIIWMSKLEGIPHINYFKDMELDIDKSFMLDIYPNIFYDSFLGLDKYDTSNRDNYKEIHKLYRTNGIQINENTVNFTKNEHPIIQATQHKKIIISSRLKEYLTSNINCYYVKELEETMKNNDYNKQLIQRLFEL